MRQQLAPQIQPKYVARIEISVIEDYSPEVEVGIMYPDIDGLKVRARSPASEVPGAMVGAGAVASITAPIPLPQVRLATVVIREELTWLSTQLAPYRSA
jgi:hypothetical protein